MTERKPRGVEWESWVDRKVREAQERGEFDNLPGAGKPIPGLDRPYDPDWWLKSYLNREELTLLPDSLELARFVEKELERIAKCHTETMIRRELATLNDEIRGRLAKTTSGPTSRVTLVDVERFVEKWRES